MLDALGALTPHDHLCSLYDTQEEQFAVAIPFMQLGLAANQKCVYIADPHDLESARQAMLASGIDVDGAVRTGALTLTTKAETYLRNGSFDPDWMFTFWQEAAQQAKREGFSALRGTGETEWVLRGGPGLERWREYESRLTDTLAETDCLALCQYNWRICPPELILDIIRTHPIVVNRGVVCRNFYYVPPHEFLHESQPAREVQRLLSNIREREQMDIALRQQQRALQQAHDQLELRVLERTREIQELNEELGQRVAALSEMNEELEAFTYSVSHDLRAPLHHIDGFSQVLTEEFGDSMSPAAAHYLVRIREGATRMGQLVDGLLQLSRVGRQQIRKQAADLKVLIREAISELEPETSGRRIEWKIGPLPVVDCDQVLMRQIFINLLSNAIKFTRQRSPAVIQVDQTHRDGWHVISVRDNGVGFNMKSAGKLFTPFRRLHHQDDFEGLGLGLATVQRIIRRHGGEIRAEAEPDRGATFSFTLPAREEVRTGASRAAAGGVQ